ncbi:MAG: hypothetical protein JO307_08845 [Bryobacterales bacterium]|nr:hypothetical protein [Bryobacterales bacterium]MBV9397439.1 hypothetical protein [Bryobacterales bacterium]
MISRFLLPSAFAALFTPGWAADYDGPRPPKPDLLYLVHADNLIPTEAAEAKNEKGDTYTVQGASSSARTPIAEPIFIMQSDRLNPESIELYRFEVKNGHRETTVSSRGRRSGRPLHLQVTKLDRNLYRIEAAETLENGEYCLTPSGSNRVFCFEEY